MRFIGRDDDAPLFSGQRKWIPSSPVISIAVLIASWYSSSSLNAVSTQQFISFSRSPFDVAISTETSPVVTGVVGFYTMSIVTILQLLAGACLGSFVFLIFGGCSSDRRHKRLHLHWYLNPALHAIGSLCTNMGFTFGSASVVQVIKLLEPMETLVVSRLLSSSSSTPISGSILASLTLMIAGTVGTLSGWNKPIRMEAIAIATLSGLALATRNSVTKLLQQVEQQQHHNPSVVPIQEPDDTNTNTKFIQGVEDFIRLSTWSAFFLFALLVGVQGVRYTLFPNNVADPTVFDVLHNISAHPKMILFHGMYNLSSLAVLGYVSALTHSVLNVGKRLVNIVVVTLFFQESVQMGRVSIGLSVATLGAIWYTLLVKKKMTTIRGRSILKRWFPWIGLVVFIVTLLMASLRIRKQLQEIQHMLHLRVHSRR